MKICARIDDLRGAELVQMILETHLGSVTHITFPLFGRARTFNPAAYLHSIPMHCIFSKILDENLFSVNYFISSYIFTLFPGCKCLYIVL